MKRNRIRLTESQLHRIIKESVRIVLKENPLDLTSFEQGIYELKDIINYCGTNRITSSNEIARKINDAMDKIEVPLNTFRNNKDSVDACDRRAPRDTYHDGLMTLDRLQVELWEDSPYSIPSNQEIIERIKKSIRLLQKYKNLILKSRAGIHLSND